LKGFLGLAGYYRRFVPQFSKNVPWLNHTFRGIELIKHFLLFTYWISSVIQSVTRMIPVMVNSMLLYNSSCRH
jgi:hypothetical protein